MVWKCLRDEGLKCNCINAIEIHLVYAALVRMKNDSKWKYDFYIYGNSLLGIACYTDDGMCMPAFPINASDADEQKAFERIVCFKNPVPCVEYDNKLSDSSTIFRYDVFDVPDATYKLQFVSMALASCAREEDEGKRYKCFLLSVFLVNTNMIEQWIDYFLSDGVNVDPNNIEMFIGLLSDVLTWSLSQDCETKEDTLCKNSIENVTEIFRDRKVKGEIDSNDIFNIYFGFLRDSAAKIRRMSIKANQIVLKYEHTPVIAIANLRKITDKIAGVRRCDIFGE